MMIPMDLKKALKGGILLSVFSFDELIEKFKTSIYYDAVLSDCNVRYLISVDNTLNNMLFMRSMHPLNDGVGHLYLCEVYEKLGLKYTGDRNIGITSISGDTWHNLYSPWINIMDRDPEEYTNCLVIVKDYDSDDTYVTALLFRDEDWYDRDGELYYSFYPNDEVLYWMPLPESPKEI